MALNAEQAYSAGRKAQRIVSLSYARTLTNNPDTVVQNSLDAECILFAQWLGYSYVPPGAAIVGNGEAVFVVNSQGFSAVSGTATTAAGVITNVKLPAGTGMLSNGAGCTVRNNSATSSLTGTTTVASGVITGVTLPATAAMISNNNTVSVMTSAGTVTGAAGTAYVDGNSTLGGIKLPTTTAPVPDGATIATANSAGVAVGASGTAVVSGGLMTGFKLPATTAPIVNGTAVTCTVTGTYVNKITPTVVNGVLTGIVLG